MLKRALIATGLLVLGSASAFAGGTCAVPGTAVPYTGLPTGDLFATTSTSSGTLNGYTSPLTGTGAWVTCVSGGAGVYNTYNSSGNSVFTSDAYIPFAPTTPQYVTISVSEVSETGNSFTLYVNNNYVSGTIGTSLVVPITNTTLNTLGILETYGLGHTSDDFSVSITKYAYIPEPATLALLGFGVVSLVVVRRRWRFI